MRKRKIAVFSYDFKPIVGGAGVHVNEIYKNRVSKVLDVDFYYPSGWLYKNPLGFLIFSLVYSLKINKVQREKKYDAINWHVGPNGFFLLRKPSRCKCVATAHHTYWQQSTKIKSQFWKRIFMVLEKITYNLSDKIIAVSEDTKKTLVSSYGIQPEKVVIIPNGVDFKRFRKLKRIKKIKNSLLFVGRLDKRKGIDFLIEAMPLIKSKLPDVKLFVIGKGKARSKLELFVKQNNLERNVKFLGFVSDEELPQWYNQVMLSVVPSVFEGFGITAIESLACGTPVVGTNTDGVRTIIKDKSFLVKYGDKSDLSRKVLLNLAKQRNQLFDVDKYSLDNVANKTKEVYL